LTLRVNIMAVQRGGAHAEGQAVFPTVQQVARAVADQQHTGAGGNGVGFGTFSLCGFHRARIVHNSQSYIRRIHEIFYFGFIGYRLVFFGATCPCG